MSFSNLVKRANEGKKTADKKSSFESLVEKAYSGNTFTKFTSDDVTNWSKSIQGVSKRASDYLSNNKYRQADTELASEVDKYLSEADDVLQYIRANKSRIKDYNNIYSAYIEAKNSLKSFSEAIHDTNDFLSNFSSEKQYEDYQIGWLNPDAETNEKIVAKRKERYASNASRAEEIETKLKSVAGSWVPNFIENWFLSDDEESLRDEMESLRAENLQYERTQGVLDDYYTPVTDEFNANGAYRDYTNASRDDLRTLNAKEDYINSLLTEGNIYDEQGNIVSAYTGDIVYEADDLSRAMYKNAVEGSSGGLIDKWTGNDAKNYRDEYYNSLVQDKLGMYFAATEDDYAEAIAELSAGAGDTNNTWAEIIRDGEALGWKHLTEHEIKIYYDLLKREGQESAYRYLEAMTTELTRRATNKRAEKIAGASGWEQLGLNITSIPMNVFGGAIALLDDTSNVLQGKDINPYSAGHSWQNDSSAIRQNTAEDINKATGNASLPWVGTTFGDAYQSIMSFADSALASYIPGGSALLGMSAASAEMKELYERGASQGQILTGGILAGAAETFFEHYSIGELKKLKNMDKKAVKGLTDWFVRTAIMGGVEASEEMATEIANTISDALVMGSQTDWVDLNTFVKNVVNAGIGGFISGGIGGGIAAKLNNAQYNKQVKKHGQGIIDNGGVDALRDLALETYGNMDNLKGVKGVNLASKLGAGIKITAKNVGKLSDFMEGTITSQNEASFTKVLVEKGLSKKAAVKVAKYLTDSNELSKEDIATIEGSKKIQTIIDEVLSDSNLDISDASVRLAAARLGVNTSKKQTEDITEEKEIEAEIETPDNASESISDIPEAVSPESIPVVDSVEQEESNVSLEEVSQRYGAQAQAMIHTYVEGQDVAQYDNAYNIAYDMGRSGVALSYVKNSKGTAYLTDSQKELAYEAGKAAADTKAKAQDTKNKQAATGKTGRRKGTVQGRDVKIDDLKKHFNDTQNRAYKTLVTIAEVTGVDIVLYNSAANDMGEFKDAQGRFKWSDNKIYIDINAGLRNIHDINDLAKFAMLRTFDHEFCHFLEKWNPIWYNELRKVVFEELTARGENVDDLILNKMNNGMDYEQASREVVAEALTDILPDSHFVENLANKHKNIFQKLLEKLKEFLANIKAYFKSLDTNRSDEANALKEQVGDAVHYVERIVELFDKVAVEAVENYQMTVAFEEKAENIVSTETKKAENKAKTEKTLFEKYNEVKQKYPNNIVLYRVGDFFEVLGEDAKSVAEWTDTTLTGRNDPNAGRVPMVGFPFHKLDKYVEKIRTHQDVTLVQEENGTVKEYPMAPVESSKPKEESVTEKKKPRTEEEKNAARKRQIGSAMARLHNLSPERQKYLSDKHNEYSGILEQLEVGDKLINDNGDVVGEVVNLDSGCIFIVGEEGFVEMILPKSFTDDGIISTLEVGEGHFEKPDGTRISDNKSLEKESVTEHRTPEVTKEKEDSLKGSEEPKTEQSIEERENAYKKKFSQWLKKSNRKYVLNYGGEKLLSNGAFGMKATEDEIGWAKLEFSGMITETDLPKQTAALLDNANTPVTEAPLEGGAGKDSVYIFNFDGRQNVYNKKLLSMLDGNLFYMGDFNGFKILKALDADGNIAGFLLPLRLNTEVTNTKPSKLKSFSSKFLSQILKQEVKPNGENADNRSTVQQSDSDRQGDSQVLERPQAEDVQGDAQGRNSVGGSIERGQETGRDGAVVDNRTGTRSGSGDGDSQSRDIRGADELTPEAKEKLHEEVTEQIVQQSTEKPKGRNFVIGDTLDLPNGEKARYKANIEAIRLVKQLETEGRYATEAEQVILSKYVGWGGLANAFDERKADWSKEYKELKELLSTEEYELARGSTLNAHYTDISVIRAMYDGLNQLGFNGGRMMEPSSGVGNFVGAMPAEMSAKVKSWTMVELDGITGLIAKYLYPNADVRIQGFEKANIPNNYMDVIISNVPFGNYPITDKAYPKKVTSAIHNYFFAKSLDKVRPGGIVMFITSSYTMNSKDETVRRYIMQRADLLGAIRLPDTAFKGNAGTEVVTDILILKKRAANTAYTGEDFLEAPYKYVNGYNGAYINNYFNNHPEMVLGTATMDGGMYRGNNLTYKALEGKGTLADQIREAFKSIKGKMEYPAKLSPEKTNFAVERADKKTKQDGYVAKNGKIYQNKDGELVEQNVNAKVAERIKGMLDIRDAAKALMNAQQQGLNETEIKKTRATLNKLYDAFVKKNGFLNAPSNRSAFNGDPDRYSVFALENWDNDKKTATKADIFSKNTISPNRTVTSAKDISEGLIVSVNQTGGVDVPLIAKLTGKTEADVNRELLDSRMAFKNRDGMLETAESYLSGNVRAKLRDAEALVPMDSDYQKNVEALKAVMPEDVSYQDIFVNPGTPWIPSNVYSDFAAYMLGTRNTEWSQAIDVTRNADTGNFTVELKNAYLKYNAQNTQKWGTPRRSFLDLFDAMLNSKSVVVKDKLEDGSSVINRDATAAANEKIENITKEFQDWLWRDEARRTELATLYNEVFNSIVTPKYNGDNLTVNGANAMKPLRPHQRNAVQRIISSGGNTLLAHKVGAGKTYEMAAAAMKLKELGLVKKPMFAVPKSLVAQWGTEFIDFFPTAKLLVAEATDFTPANRKVFMNRVANGNYDAVIVSYEQFEKLPVSDDFTRELYQEQINSVIAAIEEAKADKGGKSLSVKDLEKKRKSLQAKIDKLTDKAKDEDNIDFEQLGVDSLFIDEAHNFKNLFYTTSMTNVSGLGNKDGSKRAFDLYTKVRYLQKLNGGKGIVFATATPVMNSMSEMYIMQKYLQPDLLEQLGLNTFDAWAKQFGEVVNGVEIKPSGQGYRVKQSFSRFKNMSELQLLFRNFADVLTDIPGLKIPKMKGGAVNVVVCEPGEFQKNYMKELEQRADNIKNVDPSEDNMLKITSDGRKISYTQRMIDPSLPYEDGCKIYRCADNVIDKYKESKDIKGTQIIFLDMATPKGKSKTETTEEDDAGMDMESAQLYDDLKARLVQNGIPANEIAFIHEADTDQKKKKLFADVNEGKVRVLIGSTGKMGVGMNAQKRIVAIHHLDAPWRPGDVEQRNGRAFRQGNINDEVENFTYVTEGSFDARLWDILERKQNFINQVMNGESVGRETEDTGEVTLSAAEVKALASGSPLIMEQVQLDTDIKKLESLYRAHLSSVRAAKERLSRDKGNIELYEKFIDLGKSDMLSIVDTYSEGKFSITVGKQKFTEKKDAGVALMAEATAKAVDTGYTTIGSFAGFDVKVIKTSEGIKGLISGKQGYSFNTYPNNTTFMINHIISVVEGITERVNAWNEQIAEIKKDMAEQENLIAEPFAKQTELDEKRKRYNEVMEILNPKEEQALDSADEDTVQEQSRDYLKDHYPTEGVHWGVEDGILSIADARVVWKAIAEITKESYKYRKTVDGDYFVESEQALMIVDAHYRYPMVKTIYKFKDNDSYAKETIISAKGIEQQVREAESIIEIVYGEGYATRYDIENSSSYGRKNGRGKGKNSGTHNSETAIREWRFDDEQEQQRTYTLSDREVLEMAANEIKVSDLTQAENDALTIFQNRLSNLKDLQEKRAEQGRLYKEQQFGAKPDRAEAEKTLNRMHTLDDQIKKAMADVLTVEEKEVLKRVLQKARKVVEAKERQHGQEVIARMRDRRNNAIAIKKYRDRLRGDVDELTNWIIGPNNKDIAKHVPDVLKNSVIPFLSSINFMSKRSLKGGNATVSDKEFIKRLNALQSAIKTNIDVYGMYSGYNDLPADFLDNLQHFINTANVLLEKSAGEFIINQMTSAELKELSQIVRTLKTYITQFNHFHNNAMYKHVYEAGDNSIDFLKELDNAGSHTGGFSNFVFWQQIRPAYAFERFGEGGKAIYDGLRQGQAKLAFNTKEIVSFTEKTCSAKEVKAWENELKEFSLGRDIVKIPVANIMSFYELTKDPEAKEHIVGEGIRVATYTRKGKKISDVGHVLTVGEFNQIVSSLTDRQREVADALQKFMAEQGGKWGNYVSVARFGEELFTNPHYFPINSDGRHLSATVEEHPSAAALYALLNMSFTKSRKEGANNRIVLYSIFDVFANHMASMAQYNAMALPILDALKWFNYQQVFVDDLGNKTVIASVREQMSRVYGVPEETKPGSGNQGYAETFIVNIIKSFNGTAAQGTPYDTLGLKALHAYNIAQVAYNLRVLVQQPLAITRAGMLLDFRSILKGFSLKPSKIKQNIEEMKKYSGIAAWKSLGFYDVNISRGLTHLIKQDTSVFEKISNVGMWGAEKADLITWAAIWGAAKAEVTKKQHLTPESEGFYDAVKKLFEDVIYKTQVVDSILTKNEFMRDKGTFARFVGSFMSEATTNASMLIDAVDKYHLDMKRGMSKRDAWQKNKRYIGRTLYVFGIGAVLLAAVQAVIDAARDDDEYEEYYEKWLEQFGGNLIDELMPFNKLPIISDFYDLAKSLLSAVGVDTYGNPPSSVFMQWYDSLVKGTEIIYDKITGEDTNYTWYGCIYKLLQALSGMSGLPLGSATREIITFWNNSVGAMAPSLKVKTYESSELSQIKYAYEDGYLTYEEAVELLLEKDLADNENEAYFIIQGWEAGEGYSKYDAIFDAVRNGGNFNAAMDELTSHGYSEKEVLSQVKSKIGEWYQGGEISKSQAENMLRKYSDLNSDEITATVNKWSSYVVTGIKYEDIDDEFMEGNITASRAIEMYVRYGSMTREKATEKVTVLEFVKENPSAEGISYSAVSAYKQYCEPYGVSVEIYYDAWKYKNTISGSVKESMMAYINSLSLSKRQKDSLYFAFGWAESKLYEAPWR